MTEKKIRFHKKRELGDVISDSFGFIKQEREIITKLLVWYVLPFAVIYAVVQIFVQMKITGNIDFSDPESVMEKIGPFYSSVLMASLFGLFVQSLLAGTYYTFVQSYAKQENDPIHISDISPRFFTNSLLALGANLVLFAIVALGVVMCIIPGIYFANSFSLALMAIIFERKGIGNALSRSWRMINIHWWNTFVLNFLSIVLVSAVSFVLSIPAMIAGLSTGLFSAPGTGTTEYPDWYWILSGTSVAISTLLWIIPYTFLAFQYFNLDERTKPFFPPE